MKKIKVDVNKFKALCKTKGYNMQEISVKMGHDKNYLTGILYKGGTQEFSQQTVRLLESMYKIKPQDYILTDKPVEREEKIQQPQVKFEIDYEKLANILNDVVYKAVYAATVAAYKDM